MTMHDVILPTEGMQPVARESSRQLAGFVQNDLRVRVEGKDSVITLPAVAVRMLVDVLTQLAQGNAVNITPYHAELTTQQAADFLGVSRPHLIKLLEAGELPFRKVGTHRRVMFEQLLAYRNEQNQKRHVVLDELIADAQEHGDGY